MSCYCNSTSSCVSAARMPDFKNIFSQTLRLLHQNAYFDIMAETLSPSRSTCYWNLNISDLNAIKCTKNSTRFNTICVRSTTTASTIHYVPNTSTYDAHVQSYQSTSQAWIPGSINYYLTSATSTPEVPDMGRSVQAPANTSLLGLLALLLIPIAIIVICCFFCYMKNKKYQDKSAAGYSPFSETASAPTTPESTISHLDPGHNNFSLELEFSDHTIVHRGDDKLANVYDIENYSIERKLMHQYLLNIMDDKFDKILGPLNSIEQKVLTPPLTPGQPFESKTSAGQPDNQKYLSTIDRKATSCAPSQQISRISEHSEANISPDHSRPIKNIDATPEASSRHNSALQYNKLNADTTQLER